MKTSRVRAFTLIELLMVMVIIAIIASLIVGAAGVANRNAMRSKAKSEIAAFEDAIGKYKTDYGDIPRSASFTEPPGTYPDPRTVGDPTQTAYKSASLFLYEQLSGDLNADGKMGDTNPNYNSSDSSSAKNLPVYFAFKPSSMGGVTSSNPIGTPGVVVYLQDPYGFSYGYTTVGAYDEEDYKQKAAAGGAVTRNTSRGFNRTFDLWSTASTTISPVTDLTRQRWIKNW